MYTIAIISNDSGRVQLLSDYLNGYSRNAGLEIRCVNFTSCRAVTLNYKAEYDIIFIDMQNQRGGLNAAENIRRYDENVILIFLAEKDEYAVSGASVNIFNYYLKPLDFYSFQNEFDRVIRKLQSASGEYFFIRVKGGVIRLALKDIQFIECNNHTLTFHTCSGDFERTGVIGDIEKRLQSRGFMRCYKGSLVNLSQVDSVSGDTVYVGGTGLKISRLRRKAFLSALKEYGN